MKKMRKWLVGITAAVLVALAAFCLVACDEDNGGGNSETVTHPQEYVGIYRIETLVYEAGTKTTLNVGDRYPYEQTTITEDFFDVELKADGTATVTSKQPESKGCFNGTKTGTWGVKGGALFIDAISDNMPETGMGGHSIKYEDGKIVFGYSVSLNFYTFNLVKQAA